MASRVGGRRTHERHEVFEQTAKAFRGRGDHAAHAAGVAAGFEVRLAQVNEVTLRLQLAAATAILLTDGDAREGIGPEDDDVVRDDVAVLKRKYVQAPGKLPLFEKQ